MYNQNESHGGAEGSSSQSQLAASSNSLRHRYKTSTKVDQTVPTDGTTDYIHFISETKEVFVHKKLCLNKSGYSYPSQYFEKYNAKPVINVYHKGSTLPQLRKAVYKQLQLADTLSLTMVVAYMYKCLHNVKATVDLEGWSSYGMKIADGGQDVKLWDLVTVKEHEGEAEIPSGGIEIAETVDKYLPHLICCIYRLIEVHSNKDNFNKVLKRMSRQMPEENFMDIMSEMPALIPLCSSWINDPNFTGIIACIDMFFFRFTDHPLSALRMGTFTSRFRHCAALTTYRNTIKVSGKLGEALCKWLTCDELVQDFCRIYANDEELDIVYSYFPYQIDFSLVKRSAYSATANPNLYYFSAAVGSMLGDTRSKYAAFLLTRNIVETKHAAWLAAYVANFTRGILQQADPVELEPVVNKDDAPKTSSLKEWNEFMEKRRYVFTPQMLRWFDEVRGNFADCRPGTVGHHLYRNLGMM